jgi:hypothetical protein
MHTAVPDRHYEDRAREMGRRRRENDDRAGALADTRAQAEQNRRAVCLQRWPGILAAIKGLLAAYNDGAGAELLTASEQSNGDDPAVTITSHGSVRGTITIAVDGDALLVRTNLGSHSAPSLHAIARRIDCSRSDTGTAAYLLQDWMDQL